MLILFILMVWKTPSGENVSDNKTISFGDRERICRMYIGSLFGRSFDKVNFDRHDYDTGLTYVSYVRESDEQKFRYYCEIKGSSVVWAGWLNDSAKWGRIREEDRAEVYYKVKDKRIVIVNHGEVTLAQPE
jgi:hypothetical protein